MYILIDRQKMAIVHKHQDRTVLSNLAWIECTNAGLTIPLGNVKHFEQFSAMELRLLYKHATGADLQGYGNTLAQVVHSAAMRLPESVVNANEVAAQKLKIMDGDKSTYSYCPGSTTPTCHPGLFEPDALKCERNPAEESLVASAPTYSAPPLQSPGAPASSVFSTQVQRPSNAGAPRAGGSRETIFKVADEMWTAAGSPKDVSVVLNLRKQMMTLLESQYGMKKTTSSTTLGIWMKERLG